MSELMTASGGEAKNIFLTRKKNKEWQNVRTITKNPQSVTVECAPK